MTKSKKTNFLKSFFSSIWGSRWLTFLLSLSVLVLIKNKFNVHDEFWYAIQLLKGTKAFHDFHILSNSVSYVTWFFASLFGFKLSAFRALQISSSIFAALGAAALVDIGMFWGLTLMDALLFSSPIIFCNAFIRYGTSAYPDSLAMGVGLIAINMLIKSLNFNKLDKNRAMAIFISGLFLGLAGLMHIVFILVIPALLFGIFFIMSRIKRQLSQKIYYFILCTAGIFMILGLAYIIFLPWCLKFIPEQVHYVQPQEGLSQVLFNIIISGKSAAWLPSLNNFFLDLKTHGALFIPGVHSKNIYLDIIFNLPRLLAFPLLFWFIIKALRNWKNNIELSSWIIVFLVASFFEFVFILFSNFSHCRAYVSISLSVLGPLFLAILILAFKNQTRYRIPLIVFSSIIVFHSIFGIEGIIDITTHDNRPFAKLYNKCEVHKPKFLEFPSSVHSSLYPDCCFVDAYFVKYGHLGPPVEFLKDDQ